jgi:hypothetical protein
MTEDSHEQMEGLEAGIIIIREENQRLFYS